ncbi:hypothetical protein AM493_05050 [Flavobacterium akiainvivens]|uniref:ABM domain-containing protein n=1 Tax=Flavobacterium akiainvivens TaxID=1202724 RepID=A0A0M9VHD9_9FLAO|nr:antibiotic biosynthesis monooxygenase [Flavobacterium akiainvivens]KOS05466.1 hypothetical protein AM493_05050 [Flavobacterium akiainvivens]SFQ32536.1 Quinol monooxygenase YgiN [Flavobacterium akiainvivens]
MIQIKKCKRKRLVNCLWLIGVALCIVGCNNSNTQTERSETAKTDTVAEVYVELGFFGPVKPEKWAVLLAAVQNNVTHSRREAGNLAFNLYLPENDTLQPIWFERFQTYKAHTLHMQQDYFKKAIAVIKQSLAGEALSIALKDVKEVPAVNPKNRTAAHNSITLYTVKPGSRQQFVTAMANAAAKCRGLSNNVEYNLYQYKNEPEKFVLIEAWLNKPKNVQEPEAEYFAAEPVRYMVKDISENKNVNH